MDKDTRNRIERATQSARALLERDFADQLAGVFDIRPDGTLPTAPGSHLDAAQRVVWGKLMAAVEHHRASGQQASEAVATYLREAAFTTLNRFVALKMLEARGLVQECVSRGEQSAGFREFCGLAPGLVQLPDHGYRLYIESLFDELSTQIRVLFNRRDPAALLWLKRATLEQLLGILNAPELTGVWGEDETIGWVYQYYNDEAERKKMREESSAPRNSRELAVRNQFFTPRYVVEFLTDNTLGRLWYEMTEGQTRLKEQCRYLVRRLHEIFLAEGEAAPDGSSDGESSVVGHQSSAGDALAEDRRLETGDLTQEELLLQPVYIPHRPLKDPRDILFLDPACGSMHFGIYAFDLFGVIYEEAWDIAQGLDETLKVANPFSSFVGFAASFPDKSAFLREVPRLIIEHNIHGIDIDPRAIQIAALSLWLRAQRAWHEAGVKPADRPRIRRANLVCAEPMPGEKDLLREFVEQQFPIHERSAFHFLLDKVFDQMTLAGEAGSLLRIVEEIRSAITEARELAKEQSGPKQTSLFPEFQVPEQAKFDLTGLTDAQFWEESEQRIYDALRAYAEQAVNGSGFRRRLFAEDAAQGFAFIDLCRKRYDVVVMNPPFGSAPYLLQGYLQRIDAETWTELFTSMVSRGLLFAPNGLVGSITSRTCLTLTRLTDWRVRDLVPNVDLIADLGLGVMDNAFVEACAYVSHRKSPFYALLAKDLQGRPAPSEDLVSERWMAPALTQCIQRRAIRYLPEQRILLGLPRAISNLLHSRNCFEPLVGTVRRGFVLFDGFRFVRLSWEVAPSHIGPKNVWVWYSKGGEYQRHYGSIHIVTLRADNGAEMCAVNLSKNGQTAQAMQGSKFYFRSGVTYTSRSQRGFAARCLPSNCITSDSPAVLSEDFVSNLLILGWLNSRVVRLLIELQASAHKYEPGHIKSLPWPKISDSVVIEVEGITLESIILTRQLCLWDEKDANFIADYDGRLLRDMYAAWQFGREAKSNILAQNQKRVSNLFDLVYGCDSKEAFDSLGDIEGDDVIAAPNRQLTDFASGLVSWLIGIFFGRWDIRYATGSRQVPKLPDPFAPLPVCPPGMLQGDDGLPLSPEEGKRQRAEGRYPLDIAWDGASWWTI